MLPRTILIFCLISMLSACSQLSYYTQAVKGQWQIVSKRQEIPRLLQDPELDQELKRKLLLAQEIRGFAIENLDLPDNKTFRYYTDLNRRYAVWNVIATPPYDMSPKTWCFPVAGCVAYKGFFSEDLANEQGAELKEQDYDTFVYGVAAYSTLGWFSDPVLNTFIYSSELSLAGLIFHELAHQVVYVKDDSDFNEAFATAVEYAGIERWLIANQSDASLEAYQLRRKNSDEITEMILSYRARLADLYENAEEFNLPELKTATYHEMKQSYANFQALGKGTPFFDWWFSLELNNAHLSSIATYHRLVPVFTSILERSESFSDFYMEIQNQAQLSKPERDKWIASKGKQS
jgi:predicted aminopeptidase